MTGRGWRRPAVGLALLSLYGCASTAPAPTPYMAPGAREVRRPLPYPVTIPGSFQRAIQRGTRTTTGAPGPAYWQAWTRYRLTARLHPADKRLEGTGDLTYSNHSPDTLNPLHLQLIQNVHAPGAPRLESAEVTGGVEIKRLLVNGHELPASADTAVPRYVISDTRLSLHLPQPLPPGDSVTISMEWAFKIPKAGAGARMGWDKDNLFFIAYWYPQVAVYDDVVGWQTDLFLSNSEFYAGFATYDVTVEAPEGWLIEGTGVLRNAEETLAPEILERLRRAEESDEVVHVITEADFGRHTRPGKDGWLRWRFTADSVRDVAFSATRESLWDVARTPVGDRDGDGRTDYARVAALYRTAAPRWTHVARYSQHAIDHHSRFTSLSYPWPHMTAVEGSGIITGGMEFPMMTLIGDYNQRGDTALYDVTAHELAHMWVPMIVSNDERRRAWMDEGTTSFNENEARMEFFPGKEHFLEDQQSYAALARAEGEGELMRWSDFHYSSWAFQIASYQKPASLLRALRGVLGEETFLRAYRTYLRRWAFRHPYPWDFFRTFESVSGRDLDWFWRVWYYETWTLDQAVAEVRPERDGTRIVIEDRGWAPMPTRLTITRENGEILRREVPVDHWLAGNTRATVTVPPGSPVARVEIDAERFFPDVVRENNVWTAGGAAPRVSP